MVQNTLWILQATDEIKFHVSLSQALDHALRGLPRCQVSKNYRGNRSMYSGVPTHLREPMAQTFAFGVIIAWGS